MVSGEMLELVQSLGTVERTGKWCFVALEFRWHNIAVKWCFHSFLCTVVINEECTVVVGILMLQFWSSISRYKAFRG